MLLTTTQFGLRCIPPVTRQRVGQWIAEGRIVAQRINGRLSLIDERQLPKVSNRRKAGNPRRKVKCEP